ncbi:hypothetical protein [Sphingomonas alba]|uniref:Secreted protein n=1 Tax=Sphingomonas alba TaxID=2908208 RepID=A0ABT0RN39_9SPHN|nr:hypothetical protein [Sphingomonas alba]MCL6684048.1 hypothetical protein [Sphingomonas alba]
MSAALFLFALASSSPDIGGEATREVLRQNCVPVDKDEILVCGSRRPNEKYRMPGRDGPFDPAGETMSVMRERQSWVEEGDTGVQSCSAVGPGGWTGCMVKSWKQERDQTAWGKNVPKKW